MLLREKDKQALLAIFQESETAMEVWAYGSRVNGKGHSGSDLDLVLRTKDLAPLPFDAYIMLCEKITDSNIPILVELRDWAVLLISFHKNIEANYEFLFSSIVDVPDESF
ncbi:nucleotidyltransferase domain-containing protein [Dyadobacter sp. CY356]|uniref:nucleotidyltransferase domain-containing protein n=1 Tax=Dyadobacter sp. CY356 TaxID=2906442 RepID=UPI001F344691|nr:nucleotidyltransferase domain-containing protein [Dyadobacter sp. CY356]MCF0056125.1 nucleotidyltransferase domain-containing protein [Dyadobacter sp. CY356]